MRIFKLYDSSGGGYISKTEMQKAFGEEFSPEEMVEMGDADCDGKVRFDEFKAFMKEEDGDVPSMYRIVASTNTCYYSENQVFGGVTIRVLCSKRRCY